MKLNPNLTFKEFEALANRKPNLRGNWLYRVTQAVFKNDLKYPYPKFEFEYIRECYFRAFLAAEKYVKKNTKDIYCSWITQIPLGLSYGYGDTGAEWLYGNNGELLDYTITIGQFGNVDDHTFFGRPKARQRFQVGDIVEVLTAKGVHLAVLNHPIPDVEWCWKQYITHDEENGFFYHLDFSDDSAIVLDGPNYYSHDHVGALQLLKPRFPIPEDILEDMQTWNERCKNEDDSEWLKAGDPFREERQKEKGNELGEFYGLRIYLHFDEIAKTPHIHINDHYGFKTALHIDSPAYYDHDGYTGRFTDNQIQALYRYLTLKNFGKTRWWYMLRKWNESNENDNLTLSLDAPMPNYLELSKVD